MKINADPKRRAVVDSARLDWVDSPLVGVQRRMLERDGDEVARATTIVRFAPGSHFSAHDHTLGEEFVVLEGVFSDEHGDFPRGSYVRNPPGSSHTPRSDEGCTIFVKLRQMDPSDQASVLHRPDTDLPSRDLAVGVRAELLHQDAREVVEKLTFQAGAELPERDYPGGQEFLVLEGSLEDEHGYYDIGTWVRNPAGSRQKVRSAPGCVLYMKTGHLG